MFPVPDIFKGISLIDVAAHIFDTLLLLMKVKFQNKGKSSWFQNES